MTHEEIHDLHNYLQYPPYYTYFSHFPDYFEEVKEALVANHVVLKSKEINEWEMFCVNTQQENFKCEKHHSPSTKCWHVSKQLPPYYFSILNYQSN